MTSGAKTIDLRLDLIEKRYRDMKRTCHSYSDYSYYTFGDNSECLRKYRDFLKIFTFDDYLVTSLLT